MASPEPGHRRRRPIVIVALALALVAVAVAAVVGSVVTAGPADATTPAGTYVALSPARVLDTRVGTGGSAAGPMGTVHLQVGGVGGVPASGVSSVVLNVTVTAPTRLGFITAYADGTTMPVASNLNFVAGQTVANLVIAPVGGDGKVDLFNGSTGTTQLIADISGYYTSGTATDAGTFTSLTPDRLLDTRESLGGSVLGPLRHLAFEVAGQGQVPMGVAAVVLNVTVTAPTQLGFITAYADGTTMPVASNLNFVAGQTVPNLVIAPVGSDGEVDLYNGSTTGSVQLIADVAGYFLPGSNSAAGTLTSFAPARLLDTRSNLGGSAPGSAGIVHVQVTGIGGVPSSGVAAVVLNVTVTAPTRLGFISAYADAAAQPVVSNLNFVAGQTVPNLVIAPVGADGDVALFNGSTGTTQLIADVFGYISGTPTPPAAVTAPAASTSRYVRDITGAGTDAALMTSQGCADATANGSSGNYVIVLDIGAQSITGPQLSSGTPGVALSATNPTVRLTYAQLVTAVDGYVDGYQTCRTGSGTATIAIGTNSDGDFTSYLAANKGQDWATQVIAPISAHAAGDASIVIAAAVDTEAGFAATEAQAEQWIDAFVGTSAATLFQIGSADGCPTTLGVHGQSCSAVTDDNGVSKTWTQANYYALAHVLSPHLVALPQIYLPVQANQWADIDQTGATATDKINFVGALTEFAACGSACSLSPGQGFAALAGALSASALTPPTTLVYSTDLRIDS